MSACPVLSPIAVSPYDSAFPYTFPQLRYFQLQFIYASNYVVTLDGIFFPYRSCWFSKAVCKVFPTVRADKYCGLPWCFTAQRESVRYQCWKYDLTTTDCVKLTLYLLPISIAIVEIWSDFRYLCEGICDLVFSLILVLFLGIVKSGRLFFLFLFFFFSLLPYMYPSLYRHLRAVQK